MRKQKAREFSIFPMRLSTVPGTALSLQSS